LEELDHGWFNICKGKAVRQNLDPFLEAQKALGIERPASVLLRPPACDSITKACKIPSRKPGDGIQCFIGIKVSIKTVPSHGLLKSLVEPKPSPSEPVKKQLMCFDKARTTTSPSEGVFIHGHFDNLLGSWWECETRVPKSTPVAGNLGEIGERYDGMGGGGNYGRDEGGPSRQQQYGGYRGNSFQRPPFSRSGQFGGNQFPNSQRFGRGQG
jgi:hypothetical protein